MQIFAGSPMMWKKASYEKPEIEAFRTKVKEYGIDPVVIHALYLVNLGTSDPVLWKRSLEHLDHTLRVGESMGARAVIVHPGSFGDTTREIGIQRVLAAIKKLFKSYKGPVELLLETTAGMGNSLASRFD